MLEKNIFLKDFEAVKRFIEVVNSKPYDIELSLGDTTVNAKSINDVFSLDLTKPMKLTAHCENSGELLLQIKNYIYKGK